MKSARKWSPDVLLCADLVTPSQGQGQWKWYNIVEVNGAYQHGSYEKICLKSLCVMSNVEVFATQDRRVNMTHYTDLYITTHMDPPPPPKCSEMPENRQLLTFFPLTQKSTTYFPLITHSSV